MFSECKTCDGYTECRVVDFGCPLTKAAEAKIKDLE